MKAPRLHLRDLFWLITLVAVCIAWWLEHRRAASLQGGLDSAHKKIDSLQIEAMASKQREDVLVAEWKPKEMKWEVERTVLQIGDSNRENP